MAVASPAVDVASGRGPTGPRFVVGSYATVPKKAPELEACYYEGLAALPLCGSLELGLTAKGLISANHGNDEAWLLGQLRELGGPRSWRIVLTLITATMATAGVEPHTGLASEDESGRTAAMELGRLACAAVGRVCAALGPGAVAAVELQSGPPRAGRAAAAAGVRSSNQALVRSLRELAELDWQGAQLVLEHCDAHDGVAPVKGFLPLAEELEALRVANAAVGPGRVLVTINWARSVLETHDPSTAVEHIRQVRAAGLLGGVMFSGCSGREGPYGQWKDTHMPHGRDAGVKDFAEGSLLTGEEMCRCIVAAGGMASLAYLGIKITAKHQGDQDVAARVGINAEMLKLLSSATAAADKQLGLTSRETPESQEPAAKMARQA